MLLGHNAAVRKPFEPMSMSQISAIHRWNFQCSRPFSRTTAAQWVTTAGLEEEYNMSIGTIILIILVIALLGGFSGIGGGPFYGTGYYGGGGLGLIIVIILILVLLGRI
jgi:hypothetical protein